MSAEDKDREDRTIEQFCERLAKIEQHDVQVISRPDRENPGRGGCDARINRGGKHFALEHTTIDRFMNHRADNDRFMKVVVPVEQSISAAYPDSWIEIVVPTNAIPTRTNWQQITKTFELRCIAAIANIPFDTESLEFDFDGVPFSVSISRFEDLQNPGCIVARLLPSDLNAQQENVLKDAICKKSGQLKPYREQGLATILILDTDENIHQSLAEAFCRVAEWVSVSELDEVYIAESRRKLIWFFPIKLYEHMYPELHEFKLWRKQQYNFTYKG